MEQESPRTVPGAAPTVRRPGRRWIGAVALVLVVAIVVVTVVIVVSLPRDDGSEAGRDPWQRPFASDSIWNTPIGSNARYVDAELPFTELNNLDIAYFLRLKATDPAVDLIRPGHWRNRCSGTDETGYELNLPPGFLIPDASQNRDGSWKTPNNGFEFLLPDGRTLHNSGAGARCVVGGPIYGHSATRESVRTDIYGDGLLGGHGASRLPRIGGAIRPGELTGPEPVRHALDLVLYTKYAFSDGTKASTYRWPASDSDSYALSDRDRYQGDNPEYRIGALLALPPELEPADIGVSSAVGLKLFAALQDYGGYYTDDSAWEANLLTVDAEAEGTFPWTAREREEMGRMVAALHVVANNGPDSIGGGGTPRQPLHPALEEP